MATHYHYPDVLPLENFSNLIEESTLELQKAQGFLLRATRQPILLFKEANIYLKSNRNIVTAVMTTSYRKEDKVNGHAFQVFIASILNRAIQSWATTQGITQEVSVLVRNPNSFPSIFAVYVNDREIVQFNIYEKWYGVREKSHSKVRLARMVENEIHTLEGEIEEIDKKIEKWKGIKEKPTAFIRTPSDVFALLFKRKRMKTNIDKKVESLEKQKEGVYKDIERTKDNLPQLIQLHQTRQEYIDLITPFFMELSYSLEEEKYNLY